MTSQSKRCALCGIKESLLNPFDGEICKHHADVYPDSWAIGNRILCDFFHRSIIPKRQHDVDYISADTYGL